MSDITGGRDRDDGPDRSRPPPDPEALVNYLHGRFGDDLRSCVVYGQGEPRPIHVRDDIEAEAAQARIERVRPLYEGERRARDPDPADAAFGPLYASTHVFGGAIVVHLLDEDGLVVAISLDHAIGGRLTAFIEDCLEVLYEGSPST